MINFRFHLVSLVAVFLALALGVLMGSTVIDRAIVDRLSAQISSVKKRADEQRAENDALHDDLNSLQAFVGQALPQVVGRRLAQVPVTVVAISGVDGDAVRAVTDTLRSAGALVPGVLWVSDSLTAPDDAGLAKLATILGEPNLGGPAVRDAAFTLLGRRLATSGRAAVTLTAAAAVSTATAKNGADPLAELAAAHFVSFDTQGGGTVDLSSWPPAGARLVVVDGDQGPLPGVAGSPPSSLPIVRGASAAGGRVVLAEDFKPTAVVKDRGSVVRVVRSDDALSRSVATVDDVDDVRGRVALVLAIQELGAGRAGQYGEGPGASSQLPDPYAAPPDGVSAVSSSG